LLYPVVNLLPPLVHPESRDHLLGAGASEAQCRAASVDTNVSAQTPPVFLVHAADDGLVPVGNSIALFQAAQALGRPVDMHIYATGGHGFGVNLPPSQPAAVWPLLLAKFAMAQGVMRA
jgi:acetyl esterase/lipase